MYDIGNAVTKKSPKEMPPTIERYELPSTKKGHPYSCWKFTGLKLLLEGNMCKAGRMHR